MKATKRIVEEAALICEDGSNQNTDGTSNVYASRALKLALLAFEAAPPDDYSTDEMESDPDNWWRWWWAEAAIMLRSGWLPEGWER